MAFCSNCGSEIAPGAAFCGNCGAPVAAKVEEPAATSTVTQEVTPVAVTTQAPVASAEKVVEISPKRRLTAMLLGIFLGNFGVHNFYLGRIGRGVAQCILSVLGFILYGATIAILVDSAYYYDFEEVLAGMLPMVLSVLLLIATSIWSLVEWIIIAAGAAKDKYGRAVKNWTNN